MCTEEGGSIWTLKISFLSLTSARWLQNSKLINLISFHSRKNCSLLTPRSFEKKLKLCLSSNLTFISVLVFCLMFTCLTYQMGSSCQTKSSRTQKEVSKHRFHLCFLQQYSHMLQLFKVSPGTEVIPTCTPLSSTRPTYLIGHMWSLVMY